MNQKLGKVVSSKWRMILLIVIVALFPFYSMNKYMDNNATNYRNIESNIDSLYADSVRLNSDENLLTAYSINDQDQITSLLSEIVKLHSAFMSSDYDLAADLFNQIKMRLELFQSDDELRAFVSNELSVATLSELEPSPAYNVWPVSGKQVSNANLFGVVGAMDYFYYFMTHNTYLIWILVIVFMWDRFTGLNKQNDEIDVKSSFLSAWFEFSLSYVIGLVIFLTTTILKYGVGNFDRIFTYFDRWLGYSIHMPYLYLSIGQLLFHILIFGVMLSMNLLFTVVTRNKAYTLALTCATTLIMYMLVSSNIASISPLTYSDLLSNVHVGTTSHFLDPSNKTLIKDSGSIIKGLIVTIIPMVGLLKISKLSLKKKSDNNTVFKPLSD